MSTRILGIESSCDETAAAVVSDGSQILSSIVASQVVTHRKYGGVVPELASREHLRQIVPVVRQALAQARLTLREIDAFAATRGPGLVGSLLVGLTYAKTLAFALEKPLIPVNHLEGHVHAVFLEARQKGCEPALPAVCLIVSGGHTVLYWLERPAHAASASACGELSYRCLGQTRDDAAGEAYDKVAKLLALGYPGGPIIDQLAKQAGDGHVLSFGDTKIRGNPFDFSFSGIKTAVLYFVREHAELAPEIRARQEALARGMRQAEQLKPLCSKMTLDLVRAFQDAVVRDLVERTFAAGEETGAASILVSGGVAANSELRRQFEHRARECGLETFFPSRALSTDNAAMIAAAAYPKFLAGIRAGDSLDAEASLPLA